MRQANIVFFWLTLLVVLLGTVQPRPPVELVYFNTDEHDTIGKNFSLPSPPAIATNLTLPNGVQLTFGQIVALAGDYYGVPAKPIINQSSPNTADTQGRRTRFLAAYDTLARKTGTAHAKEVQRLVQMIAHDHRVTQTGRGTLHTDQEWDEATGGMWSFGVPWSFGRMLKLAVTNYDHFQPQAKKAYLVGHTLALEKARAAKREATDILKKKKLMEAYSLDAFAGHFLTDCFSSGHIRTPRVELHDKVSPSQVGDLLSKHMHDEDCKYGLRVKNKNGDTWNCYGDKYLMKSWNQQNREKVVQAMNKSVHQVHKAYQNPNATIDTSEVTDIIPFVDPARQNNKPLFVMKNSKLHRRTNVRNLSDATTTDDWWGTTTANSLRSAAGEKTNPAIPLLS